ncbi:MAG TPA: hypothetical protein VHS80_15535 [Chthoniobacterales bacterium]|nr:hypothetical protein [Chthoniobacterales bacterium]
MKTFLDLSRNPLLHAWVKFSIVIVIVSTMATPAYADGLSVFIDPLKQGLNLIVVFGFIAGCVMVIGGFLNARRDENWKMTVIYGIGVAGAVALMKALFSIFGGNAATTVAGF